MRNNNCSRAPTTFIFKISGHCNLRCNYCYYFNDKQNIAGKLADLSLVSKFLYEAASLTDLVEIIWHGGEPLTMGLDAFGRVVDVQRQIEEKENVKFRNRIQTNGTLVNNSWVNFFQQNNFGVGISLDGPKWLHDTNRRYSSDCGSFEKVMQGVERLQGGGISFGALAVVTNHSLGHEEEIFDFFVENEIRRFDFLPCAEMQTTSHISADTRLMDGSLIEGEFGNFMVRMFDLWLERDDPKTRIRYLEQVLKSLLGGKASLCNLSKKCASFVTIDFDGAVLPCDNLVGYSAAKFGNLYTNSLTEMLQGTDRQQFLDVVATLDQECQECQFLAHCGGGCSKYNFLRGSQSKQKNYFCKDRRLIFNHILNQFSLGKSLIRVPQALPLS